MIHRTIRQRVDVVRVETSREFGLDHAETFRRMRELYPAYSEVGLRVGHLGVRQFVIVK